VIGGAALVFFGPDKLTDIAKEAGKSAAALKDASSAFQEGLAEASVSEEGDAKKKKLTEAEDK
jgi:Sec-independent protein translocase protein TatA